MRKEILILLAATVLGCTQDAPDESEFAGSKTPGIFTLDSSGSDIGSSGQDSSPRNPDEPDSVAAVDLSTQPDTDSGEDTSLSEDIPPPSADSVDTVDSGPATEQDQVASQDAPEDTSEPDTGTDADSYPPYKVTNPLGAEKMLWGTVSHQMGVCSNCLSSKLGCSKDGKFLLECKYDFKQSCYTWQKKQDCTVWPSSVKKFHAPCVVYACAKFPAKWGGKVGCTGLTKKDSLNAPCSDDKPCFLFDKCQTPIGYSAGSGFGGECRGTNYYELGACDDGEPCTMDYCQGVVSDGKGNWVQGPWCKHSFQWSYTQSDQCKWLQEIKSKTQVGECYTDPFKKKAPPDAAKCPWKTDYP